MGELKVIHKNNGVVEHYVVKNPVYVDALFHLNKVAVDGEIITDVIEVEYTNE